ncbi:MAG TPA: type III polyketide synthase [Acidimicrobiales bacterium]|nr:type III polyketide synthase [Acidimicrobiales bacterium]
MVSAQIASIAAALPAPVDQRALWHECFEARYREVRGARRIWASAGVVTRHAVMDPRVEDVSQWSTGTRMQRYVAEAVPLAKQAVQSALEEAHLRAEDVDFLAVVSCTGYAAPGLDLMLARDLAMAPTVERLVIGHMGCYGAFPGLRAAADAVVARQATAVLLCTELSSLHLQPASRDLDQLVANALFSDAAVAVVVRGSAHGLRLIDITAVTDSVHIDAMTWRVTDLGFRMGLSPRVPELLARQVRPAVEALLQRHHVALSDVGGWAIHPGGPSILRACATALGLDDTALAPSRDVLREHGNCSSATVLLVLDRLRHEGRVKAGDPIVAMAFGPGLTLYAALLRADDSC